MKKIGVFAFTLLCAASLVRAKSVVLTTPLVNEPALAYSKNYTLDLNTGGQNGRNIDDISFVATYSSTTPSAITFTDGGVATGSITVASTSSLAAAQATDTLTVGADSTLGPVAATNTITVVSTSGLTGATLTYNGVAFRNGVDFTSVATTTGTAASITTALNTAIGITAVRTNSTIAITATASGPIGNSYTLTSSTPSALTVTSANFTGGAAGALDNAIITINGKELRNGYEWRATSLSTETATAIAAVLNRISGISASASSSVITLTASSAGTAGNAFTISENSTGLSAGGANFTGGVDNAVVSISGTALTQGTAWTAVGTTTGTAQAILVAIQANTAINAIVSSSRSSAVITLTSRAQGASVGYSLTATPGSSLTVSGATMTGNTAPAWTINTGVITKTAHGLTLGLPVLYSTGAIAIGGLTNQTTYYAIPVDANSFELATTSTGAVAGNFVTLTSSSTAGPHTYTLTPTAFAGTWGFKWQASNDNTNFFDLPNVSSVTYSTPNTQGWDGPINYRYLRFHVDAGTGGGLNVVVTPNGKNTN